MDDNQVLQEIIEGEMARRMRIWWDQELPQVQDVALEVLAQNRRSRLGLAGRALESGGRSSPNLETKSLLDASTVVATTLAEREAEFWTLVSDLCRYQRAICAGCKAFAALLPGVGYWTNWADLRKGKISKSKFPVYLSRLRAITVVLDSEKTDWRRAALPRGPGPYWSALKLKALAHHIIVVQERSGSSLNTFIERNRAVLGVKSNLTDMMSLEKAPGSLPEWIGRLETFLVTQKTGINLPS